MGDAECKEFSFVFFDTCGGVVSEKPRDGIGEGSSVACCLRIYAAIAIAKTCRVEG